jgi:glycosyltransferase involved in cell wall biosynthesis
MKISLIIPAYNEEKYINECLKSVERYGQGLFEVIVVDNASTDKTAEVARSFPFARVVSEPRKGLLFARQKGYEESHGDFLAYIDSDTRIHPSWFEKITKEFNKNNKIVILSGPYRYYDMPKMKKIIAEIIWWIIFPPAYLLSRRVIHGGNFVVKREALEKINDFDISIPFHGEDTDLARRLSYYGKIKYKVNFFINISGRRLLNEGLLKSYIIYGLNFLWVIFLKKPLTKTYKDHR